MWSCFSLKGTEELYGLSPDPLEKNNLAHERGGKEIKTGRAEVLAWYPRVYISRFRGVFGTCGRA